MKEPIKLNLIDYSYLVFLFAFTFILFTLPVKENPLPFGEGDAAIQFGMADWISYSNEISTKRPYYLAPWHWEVNPDDPYTPINPIPNFINQAIFQKFTRSRFLPVTYYFTLSCIFLSALAVFIIMRLNYYLSYAMVASFLSMLSLNTTLSYLWGQRLILIGIPFVILSVHCHFLYLKSYMDEKESIKYIILSSLFLAFSAISHAQAGIAGVISLAVLTFFMMLFYKKRPFSFKATGVFLIIFILLFSPFILDLMSFQKFLKEQKEENTGFNVIELFHWYKVRPNLGNKEFFTFSVLSISKYLIPFLVIGLAYLLMKRDKKSILVLSLLIGLYISIHLYLFGITTYGRASRFVKFTPFIFSILISIGTFSLTGFVKFKNPMKKKINLGIAALFILLLILFVVPNNQKILANAYKFPSRINQAQVDAANWLSENTEYKEDNIRFRGAITYPKLAFFYALSHRRISGTMLAGEKAIEDPEHGQTNRNYAVFDYSDLELFKDNPQFKDLYIEMKEIESRINTSRKIYDKGNIRIYVIKGIEDEIW